MTAILSALRTAGGAGMNILILAIILVAAYNATAATMGWKLKWSIAFYWTLVAAYWLMKVSEMG